MVLTIRSEYNGLIEFIQKAGIRIRNLEGSGLGLGGKRSREDGSSPGRMSRY